MTTPIQESATRIESTQAQLIGLYEKLEQVRESENQLKAMISQLKITIEQCRKEAAEAAAAEVEG